MKLCSDCANLKDKKLGMLDKTEKVCYVKTKKTLYIKKGFRFCRKYVPNKLIMDYGVPKKHG